MNPPSAFYNNLNIRKSVHVNEISWTEKQSWLFSICSIAIIGHGTGLLWPTLHYSIKFFASAIVDQKIYRPHTKPCLVDTVKAVDL